MRVLDTNVLIYFLAGELSVTRRLDAWRAEHETFLISTLAQAEVLSLPKLTSADIERIEGLLATMTLVPVDAPIARLAAEFRRRYRGELADAVIAATAFLRDAPLVTRNARDFAKVREIEVERI